VIKKAYDQAKKSVSKFSLKKKAQRGNWEKKNGYFARTRGFACRKGGNLEKKSRFEKKQAWRTSEGTKEENHGTMGLGVDGKGKPTTQTHCGLHRRWTSCIGKGKKPKLKRNENKLPEEKNRTCPINEERALHRENGKAWQRKSSDIKVTSRGDGTSKKTKKGYQKRKT